MESIGDSMKYFKTNDGFVYKKSNENTQTVYFDCFNEPNCIAGARFNKQTGLVEKFGTHSHEKLEESGIFKIEFESLLKNQARSSEFANVSVLNLYKNALAGYFKGIWLPNDHKATFLTKLRRIRKYEKEKVKAGKVCTRPSRAPTLTSVVSTSLMSPNSVASDHVISSILRETPNQVSPIILSPSTPILIPPPTPFASDRPLLRRSTRSQNSLVLQTNSNSSTSSSPLSENINIRLVAKGSRTPVCFVSCKRSATKTSIDATIKKATQSKKKSTVKTNATKKKTASKQAHGMMTRSKTTKATSRKNVSFADGLQQCRRMLFASNDDLNKNDEA
ncbi:uncharacterized protein LOC116342708 [Contarinia nasturtii]|uniref:uncharacterized protein LOC116342708 n=1 Tax=Contarinia nasturtii TaxID=265458 RepID=UPI0012D444DD|nr:uncharacterized protein LOC116342708 [Contarinia nasturtii]